MWKLHVFAIVSRQFLSGSASMNVYHFASETKNNGLNRRRTSQRKMATSNLTASAWVSLAWRKVYYFQSAVI